MRLAPPILSTLLVALASLHAAPARACSPLYDEEVWSVTPSGDSYPANAPILIDGGRLAFTVNPDGTPADLSVTVDGEPAGLRLDGLRSHYITWTSEGATRLALFVEPTPAPGQVVHLEGDACWGSGSCPVLVEYTATEAVVDDVPAPSAVAFTADAVAPYDEDPWSVDSCGGMPSVATVSTRVETPPFDAGVDDWRRLVVTVSRGADLATRVVELDGEGVLEPGFYLDAREVGYPAELDGICVTARVITLTSEGPATTTCDPCPGELADGSLECVGGGCAVTGSGRSLPPAAPWALAALALLRWRRTARAR